MNIIYYILMISFFAIFTLCEDNNCSKLTDCNSCALTPGCGYCGSSNLCVPGNSVGPINIDDCDQKDWNPCSKKCGGKILCGDCVLSKCGWCYSSKYSNCMFGSEKGPFNSTCNETWIFGDVNKCPAKDYCTTYSYCSACVENKNCGWCHTTSRCERGTSSGPDKSTCKEWKFDSCPKFSASKLWWAILLAIVAGILVVGICLGIFMKRKNKGYTKIKGGEKDGSYSMHIAP